MTAPGPAVGSVLDPDRLTYHQHVTFSADSFAVAMGRSGDFRVSARGDATVAEWTRRDPEDDPSPFAYGRVTMAGSLVAVESFSEEWLESLVRTLDALASGALARDETRAIAFPELLANPRSILRPEGEPRGLAGARADVAARFLRLAWPFLPGEELGGRTPEAAITTGRGREAVAGLLPSLPERLRTRWPEFPDLDPEELNDILFPAAPPAPKPGAAPAPTDPRSI